MLADMRLRNFSLETQRSYIHYIADQAEHFGVSPDQLGPEAVREYRLYLTEQRKLSPDTVNCCTAAAKFLYQTTLELPWSDRHFVRARVLSKLPVTLSATEVSHLFSAIGVLKRRAVLMVCYGAGLRISEAVRLRPSDIDSSRMLIRIEQGEGAKERYVPLAPRLLAILREYCPRARPVAPWLFPAIKAYRHISPATIQQMCREAALLAGIDKRVTAHTLRHGFATQLLETAKTSGSFRCCSATNASIPRPGIRRSRRNALPPRNRRSTSYPRRANAAAPAKTAEIASHVHASPPAGRHLRQYGPAYRAQNARRWRICA